MQLNIEKYIEERIQDEFRCCMNNLTEKIKQDILVDNKPFLTLDDVCKITGLSRSTLYTYINLKKISYYKPSGKNVYFTLKNVKDFILDEQHYYKSKGELIKEADNLYLKDKVMNFSKNFKGQKMDRKKLSG
jgi:excisionase family DNA binding protein